MMLDKSIETGNGYAVPPEATPQPNGVPSYDRLKRLQAALSGVSQVWQRVGAEASSAESSPIVDDRDKRLAAALRIVIENYDGLEHAIADADDEGGLAESIRLDDSQTALALEHMWLASQIARRFTHRGESFNDLQQVASLGLILAAARFDPERGFEFTSFAGATIRGEIKRHFRDKTWSVKAPRRAKDMSVNIRKVQQELTHRFMRLPTRAEIAEELGVDEDSLMDAVVARNSYRAASLDAPVSFNNDDISVKDSVVLEESDYEEVGDKLLVENLLATLEPREAQIMRARAGLPPFTGEHSQSEIAKIMGISQVHVSRLERSALYKLSNLVTEDDLLTY